MVLCGHGTLMWVLLDPVDEKAQEVGWVAQAAQHHRPPRLRAGLVSIGFQRHRALAEKLESSHGPELG